MIIFNWIRVYKHVQMCSNAHTMKDMPALSCVWFDSIMDVIPTNRTNWIDRIHDAELSTLFVKPFCSCDATWQFEWMFVCIIVIIQIYKCAFKTVLIFFLQSTSPAAHNHILYYNASYEPLHRLFLIEKLKHMFFLVLFMEVTYPNWDKKYPF